MSDQISLFEDDTPMIVGASLPMVPKAQGCGAAGISLEVIP